MKERIIGLIKIYLTFVCFFIIQKPLFLLRYHSLYEGVSWVSTFPVIWHGLPLDLSVAAYLTIIPGFFLIFSAWTLSNTLRRFWNAYYLFVSIVMSAIFIVDLALYEYWGFRLDATPLFYFSSSPKDAFASVSVWTVILGIVAIAVYACLTYRILLLIQKGMWRSLKLPYKRLTISGVVLLLVAALFILIRGGVTVSTMNTGEVYFSSNLRLNHAAINPAFSLMESLAKQKDFAHQYRFMKANEADRMMHSLVDPQVLDSTDIIPDSLRTRLFNQERPNVLLVIMESFSSKLMATLGGRADVAVHLDSLGREGILFTHFYANSFRTDRGMVAVLSGYPAQPTTSIMKYPRKTQSLPSIAGCLKKAGYQTAYYYGGDADFTNMRSYVIASGFDKLISDVDFPVSERLSKWGVHDHLVFNRLYQDLETEAASGLHHPFFKVLQTSSSHEPFEVPYRRLSNNTLNAFAYADSCMGDFVKRFRKLPQWKNTVVIFVPDHLGAYPEHINNLTVERYQIPLIMVGGAVRSPMRIPVYGSQHDIAATLLAQLGLLHHQFTFSKDLLNPGTPHFAFFAVPDAFGMVTPENRLIFNCEAGKVAVDDGVRKGKNLLPGKAYLQKIYDDIANR